MVERQLGDTLGLSIGTAIPMEKLLTTNVSKEYNALYLNVRTLYRNYVGSFPANQIPDGKELYNGFLEELDTIQGIVNMSLPSSMRMVYYYMTYDSLQSIFTKCKLKVSQTQIQKNYSGIESFVFANIASKIKPELEVYDTKLNGNHTKGLIITHIPLDLLGHPTFSKLTLLESHTGTFKNKSEWISKLTKNGTYSNIPFNVLTMQIIGDRSGLFSAMPNKFIKTYVELAKACKWTPSTNIEKIKFDIRKVSDKAVASVLLELANARLK